MWYEILPAAGVIFGAMAFAQWGPCIIPTLFLDRQSGFKRLFHPYEWEYWKRDRQLTGSAYKLQGLEALPGDVPSTSAKK